MKKKMILAAISIIIIIGCIAAFVSCGEKISGTPPHSDFKIDNFRQLRISFPVTILVPEKYTGEEIWLRNKEELTPNELNKLIDNVRYRSLLVESLVGGSWYLNNSEYKISVYFDIYENLIGKEENFLDDGYENAIINGYKAYRKNNIDENGKSNSQVYFIDEINKIEYNVSCATVVNDKRINTDTIINKYIDSMCLRNGIGFNDI